MKAIRRMVLCGLILLGLGSVLLTADVAEDGFIALAPVELEETRIVIAEGGLLFFVDTEFKFITKGRKK